MMRASLRARLGAYLYIANIYAAGPDRLITSEEIGARTGVFSTQVRRDISTLPRLIGRRGAGYRPASLAALIRAELAGDASGAGALLIAAHAAHPEWPTGDVLARGVESARALERAAVA